VDLSNQSRSITKQPLQKPVIHESRIEILMAVPVRPLIDWRIKLIYFEEAKQYRGVTEPPLTFIHGPEHL